MRAVLFILFVLLAPSAHAGRGELSVDMEGTREVRVTGDLGASSSSAALDLTSSAPGSILITLTALEAHGELVVREGATYGGVGPDLITDLDDIDGDGSSKRIERTDVAIEELRCFEGCLLLLVADADNGTLEVSGKTAGVLQRSTQEFRRCSATCDPADEFIAALQAGAFLFGEGAGATELTGSSAGASGSVWFLAKNATGVLRDANETTPFDTRGAERSTLPNGLRRERTTSWLILRLESASLDLPPGAPFTFHASEPSLDVNGRVELLDARGELHYAGERRILRGDDVAMEAAITHRTSAEDAVAAPAVGAPILPETGGALEGRARWVMVNGALVGGTGPTAAATAGTVSAAALLLALLALSSRLWLGVLYTRIGPREVLENVNRRRILETLRATPALSASAIGRELGLARIVIRHHLRMLEAHRVVTTRASGTQRLYFLVNMAPTAAPFALQQLLADPTRRRVADVVTRRPNATQSEIQHETGFSQRLVAYHLAKLADGGVLMVEEGRPKRYRATSAPLASADEPASVGS